MDTLEINCKSCKTGECCREGVDVDLEEAIRISHLNLRIKKPWFKGPYPDKDFPSGWMLETVIRNRTCVFQDKDKRCAIYEMRPRYCREFPFEDGRISPEYRRLCRHRNKPKRLLGDSSR